jgi:hypothetical protein
LRAQSKRFLKAKWNQRKIRRRVAPPGWPSVPGSGTRGSRKGRVKVAESAAALCVMVRRLAWANASPTSESRRRAVCIPPSEEAWSAIGNSGSTCFAGSSAKFLLFGQRHMGFQKHRAGSRDSLKQLQDLGDKNFARRSLSGEISKI